jgi:Tol biopolymer transport system component
MAMPMETPEGAVMSRLLIILATLAGLGSALAFLLVASASAGPAAATMRVSVSSSGQQADREAYAVGLSGNGRVVLINSQATDLVSGDTNKRWDVFVHDRSNGKTERVSVSTGGAQARATRDPWGGSIAGGISANGRYVVFQSDAPNLVPGDTNRVADVFLHDRASGVTKRVSIGAHGQANGASGFAAISANGRYVAFQSAASNLVARDTNRIVDVFVRDLATGKMSRVSVSSHGAQAACKGGCESTEPELSADGRYVAFESSATNLVRGDTNKLADVFVRDRRTGRTERVSVTSKGKQAGADRTNNGSNAPSISGDGRYVAFHSADSNLVPGDTNRTFDIFVHDRKTGRTTRISVSSAGRQANGESVGAPSFSVDGRYVAFSSLASNLVPGDDKANDIMDVFVRDLRAGTTTIASLGAAGQHGADSSAVSGIAFSSDDHVLAFSSFASNFVPGDTNGTADAFLRELKAGSRYSSACVEGNRQ